MFRLICAFCMLATTCQGQLYGKGETHEINGKKVVFGNTEVTDMDAVSDPVTGNVGTRHIAYALPASVDGMPVLTENDADARNADAAHITEKTMLGNLKQMLPADKLDDGQLILKVKNIAVDQYGTVFYSDFHGILYTNDKDHKVRTLEFDRPGVLFANVHVTPAGALSGRRVAFIRQLNMDQISVQIRNHRLVY